MCKQISIYIYICIYIYIYNIYIYTYLSISLSLSLYIYISMHIYIYIHMHTRFTLSALRRPFRRRALCRFGAATESIITTMLLLLLLLLLLMIIVIILHHHVPFCRFGATSESHQVAFRFAVGNRVESTGRGDLEQAGPEASAGHNM